MRFAERWLRLTQVLTWLVAASLGWSTLTAQRSDTTQSRVRISGGVTIATPKDVNVKPSCTELGLPCNTPRTFPDFGLAVEVAAPVATHAALVAEASLYANAWDTVATTGHGRRVNHVRALLGGLRLTTGRRTVGNSVDAEGYRAFVQLLVGPEASSVAPTRFALQPGAGAEIDTSNPHAAVRVQLDYRWTRGAPRNLSTSRGLVGLVLAP